MSVDEMFSSQEDVRKEESHALSFPLSKEDILTLEREDYWRVVKGEATLSSGSVTVTNSKIKETSVVLLTYKTQSNHGYLKATPSSGSMDIDSTNASDDSEVFYIIFL